MASIAKRFLFHPSRCPRRISFCSTRRAVAPWQRPFSSTVSRFDAKSEEKVNVKSEEKAEWNVLLKDLYDLDPELLEDAKKAQVGMEFASDVEWSDDEVEVDELDFGGKIGFWGEGEEELGPDEDYYGDDITSLGHGELEQHRELREYARLAAWELPLLSNLAKPFEPPSKATPFRFRYTSYLGEQHPAANKVVVEFCVTDMPDLTTQQKDKLIKLAGVRYNPETEIVKMSCELYETIAQNKRHLGETINDLLKEARDGKETFADVPFDFRHHKPKVRHEYPKEWLLTPERKQYLEGKRAQKLKLDKEREEKGKLLDGAYIVEEALINNLQAQPVPELAQVGAGRGNRQRLR